MKKFLILLLTVTTYTHGKNNEIEAFDFSGVVVAGVNLDVLPYKNTETQIAPALFAMGRMNQLFIEGNRLGYLVTRTEHGAFSLVGQLRNHQYLPKTNGIERNKAIEVGGQWAKPLTMGWATQVSVFTDISETHKGQELEWSVYRRDRFGDFSLLTNVAIQAQTSKLTGYYANYQSYRASADTVAELELIGRYDFTHNISAVAVYRHYWHGSGLSNSPLTDSNQTERLIIGLGWRF